MFAVHEALPSSLTEIGFPGGGAACPSDPWRLTIVRRLLESGDEEFSCSDFEMDICKATRSHHFQVLREAGLVRMRSDGNKCRTSLRRKEIEERFPGLLAVIARGER